MKIFSEVFIATCLLSCSPAALREGELKKYILDESNGVHQMRSRGETNVEVLYKPSALAWAEELEFDRGEGEHNPMVERRDSLSYFMIRFSSGGNEIENQFISDKDKFSAVVNYLSFELARDVSLVTKGDTIEALDVIYARTFGSSGGTDVMAIFDGDVQKKNEDVTLVLNDRVLGTGLSLFTFEKSDLSKIPDLTLN